MRRMTLFALLGGAVAFGLGEAWRAWQRPAPGVERRAAAPPAPAPPVADPAPPSAPPSITLSDSRLDDDASERLRLGLDLLEDGDFWGAVPHFSAAYEAMPDDAAACILLGAAYYQLNLMRDAVELRPCLERAARGGHRDARMVLEKLDRGAPVESEFRLATSDHFLASYPVGGAPEAAVGEVLDLLERARTRVAREIGFRSDHKVSVVIYGGEGYRQVTDAPDWAPGLYDGKIRIDSRLLEVESERLGTILAHEYTHALLHQLTGRRIPTWLNEGMAVLLSGEHLDSGHMLRGLREMDWLPDLDELSGSYRYPSEERTVLAYRQAYWMARGLVEEEGWLRVIWMLGFLEHDRSVPFDVGFRRAFDEEPGEYLDRWYDQWLGSG